MLTTASIIALVVFAWTALSLLVGIAVGQMLRRRDPRPAVQHSPSPPRVLAPAA